MKIIFFGSSHFGAPALRALLAERCEVACVVTQPDRKKGRGLRVEATAIKSIAEECSLKLYQPEKINTPEAADFLKKLQPDLFVVIAYGQILSEAVLGIPKIFALNVHASLLPYYRGAAPINWAIINGESITGVTVMKMVKEMDAGPMILKRSISIAGDDTAITLEDRLSNLAARSLLEALKDIEDNKIELTLQDKDKVSFAPKLKKEDGLIDWDKSAREINDLIKGCLGWPGAFTYHKGKSIKIHSAGICALPEVPGGFYPGQVIRSDKDGILAAAKTGGILIKELQLEGKRVMLARDFICGHKVSVGERFSKK